MATGEARNDAEPSDPPEGNDGDATEQHLSHARELLERARSRFEAHEEPPMGDKDGSP